MIRSQELQLRLDREDTLMTGRRHTRFTQMVNGVPVYGADVARQTDEKGLTISIFGNVYEGIDISTTPALSSDRVRTLIAERTGVELGPGREPRLTILPRENGAFTLVYTARVATPEDLTLYFIDAHTGAVVAQRSDAKRQEASVGVGTGVLGERKKVSSSSQGGTFVGSDRLRPPVIETYDMRGNLNRLLEHPQRLHRPGGERLRQRLGQRLDRRRQRGRPRLHRLHLRLLLQAVRAPRPRQREHQDPELHASGEPSGRATGRPPACSSRSS